MPRPLLVPCVGWNNVMAMGHGSWVMWVMGHERWPISVSAMHPIHFMFGNLGCSFRSRWIEWRYFPFDKIEDGWLTTIVRINSFPDRCGTCFLLKFPIGFIFEIYTASRGFPATARLLLNTCDKPQLCSIVHTSFFTTKLSQPLIVQKRDHHQTRFSHPRALIDLYLARYATLHRTANLVTIS